MPCAPSRIMSMAPAVSLRGEIMMRLICITQSEEFMRSMMSIIYWLMGLKRRSATIEGFQIVYLEKGKGPVLILLHGLGANKDSFLPVISKLAKRYRVIVPDLPGFGDSSRPEEQTYLASDQAKRLRAFTQELGLDQIAIGGNSMGGLIAGIYACEYPAQMECVWLLAPAGVKSARQSPLMESLAAGEPAKILARTVDEVRELIRFTMFKPPFLPGFVLRAMAADQAERYAHHDRIMRAMVADEGLDERLERSPLTCPALIVWGHNDQALDVSGADVLNRLIEPSQKILLNETGHVPHMEVPGTVVKDYLAFRSAFNLS
jgi:pimeloyl-ACP methyl ester carboxylesterase